MSGSKKEGGGSSKRSAGILLYRRAPEGFEVLIAHMGGPYWAGKDERAWTIPKGEPNPGEPPVDAARREFEEELGHPAPADGLISLGEIAQSSRKTLEIWAAEGELDTGDIRSNSFEMEWPPGSGKMRSFPEIDRAQWVDVETARRKLVKGQVPLLDRLLMHVGN